jgi:predicted DNA binding protein
MNEIDWSKAPDGAMRYSVEIDSWLEKKTDGVWYTKLSTGEHYKGPSQPLAREHWRDATPRPEPTTPNDIDTTITQRGERYGKFKDGSVIMQDLKNIMRETPNWEGLTPSQREALEMIQHKIGRILNGDPMYVDSWTDISGYSKLIADELNGAVR